MSQVVQEHSRVTAMSIDQDKFARMAKAYCIVNSLVFLQICFFGAFILLPAYIVSLQETMGMILMILPVLFLLLSIVLIIATSYLGKAVMGNGWVLPVILSFFGGFVTSLVFTSLAARQLKKNGYIVGLISAAPKDFN